MTKKWIAINVLLLLAVGLLGRHLIGSIDRFKKGNDLEIIRTPDPASKKPTIPEATLSPLAPPKMYNALEYAVIADRTIFSDTRTKQPIIEDPRTLVQPLTQKPILIATFISETQKRALIIDPSAPMQNPAANMPSSMGGMPNPPGMPGSMGGMPNPPGMPNSSAAASTAIVVNSNRPTQSMQPKQAVQVKRIGDVYQNYTVTNITAEEMILEGGGRREIIPLHEGTKRTQAMGKTPIRQTQVVSFGAGSTTGSGGTMTMQGPNGTTIQVRNQTPAGNTNPQNNMPGGGQPGGNRGGGGGNIPQGLQNIIQQLTTPGSGGQVQLSDPTTIMRTLFGDQAPRTGTQTQPQGNTINTPFGNTPRPPGQ